MKFPNYDTFSDPEIYNEKISFDGMNLFFDGMKKTQSFDGMNPFFLTEWKKHNGPVL